MTSEQELQLDSARLSVRRALNLIDTLFDDKDVSPEDFDSDLSEAINHCNSAIEFLYGAKP